MNFDLDPQQQSLAKKLRELVQGGGLPLPDVLDDAPPGELEAALRLCLRRLGEAGYLSAAMGRAKKGELLSLLFAQQELARCSPALLFSCELGRMLGGFIADRGSAAQQRRFLEAIAAGEQVAAVAVSESGAVASTRAEKEGDGYRLTGEKPQVSLAPMADLIGVHAVTEAGPALFLVPSGAEGLEVGPRIRTLGYETLCTSPVSLDGVRVPAEHVIAPFGEGELQAELRATEDRAFTAASLGILRLCLEEAARYANTPRGGGQPPAGRQLVRFALAEMLTLAQTAEILARRAFAAMIAGDGDAPTLMLCAKVLATESACQVSAQALQLMSSTGYRRGNPVERAFRNARLGPIVGHTSEQARMAIADSLFLPE